LLLYCGCILSFHLQVWRVRKELIPRLNEAFYSGVKVLLLFSLSDSDQVQGCVTMLSPIPEEPALPSSSSSSSALVSTRAPDEALKEGEGGGNRSNDAGHRLGKGEQEEEKAEKEEEKKEDDEAKEKTAEEENHENDEDDDEEDDDEEEDSEALFSAHFGVSWDRGEGCMRECDLSSLDDLPNKLQVFYYFCWLVNVWLNERFVVVQV